MFWSILLSIEYKIRTIHISYITIYPISLTFQFVWQEQDFVDVLTGDKMIQYDMTGVIFLITSLFQSNRLLAEYSEKLWPSSNIRLSSTVDRLSESAEYDPHL